MRRSHSSTIADEIIESVGRFCTRTNDSVHENLLWRFDHMKIEEMRRLLIVGAGTMGQQIGLQCAMHGYQVVLYDIEARALEAAQRHIENFADQLVGAGRLTSEGAKEALARITTTGDPRKA